MLSAPSTDPQMKFLGKLDALHQKMLPYNLFKVNVYRHCYTALMLVP